MTADMLLAMLKGMSPSARDNLLNSMDETSKVSIILMDLLNRLTKLSNELRLGPWATMKVPGTLSTIVIDAIDNITKDMAARNKEKDPMLAVAEKILKEMEGYVSEEGQGKNRDPKKPPKGTRGKGPKNIH